MEEEKYGIDQENSHPRAIELIPEEFFWSCIDELAPFGSDEGDTALAEYRRWRQSFPQTPTIECLKWVIEGVGEMSIEDYNQSLLEKNLIKSQLKDGEFDDQQYIYTLDISVIATGFAQLVDEGVIEPQNKPIIQLAIDRQIIWAGLTDGWSHAKEYVGYLEVLTRALKNA
ncbi:hypothetical protein [Pinibacter aurantiacus]|uniref:Uncharacterized protein n=1 Tax=Pinibacter aurantiacus TaxID=2851599 RepID=A0A9E2SF67_9BACT|nr:hypothetical protein [Pinibacter aurantiacus]MBV4359720.1 hypothetical protein [Pinibacter aurantiacus]